jgi:hypothetical protein
MPTIRVAMICNDDASLAQIVAAELDNEEVPSSLPIAAIVPWYPERAAEPWCRRLVMEFPELTVYSLRADAATRYRGVVHAHTISRRELLAEVLGLPQDVHPMPIVRFESPELDR